MEIIVADCLIQWKEGKKLEHVLMSIDGYDDDNIFFVCNSKEEFERLSKNGNGEDFNIIRYTYIKYAI